MRDRYDVLADELREQVTSGDPTVEVGPDHEITWERAPDIYVRAHEHDVDNALTLAHDHGFTPNGVIQSGDEHVAFRLKPRAESEVSL